MAQNKIVGYKQIFGFVLPDWVNESMIRNVALGLLTVVVMMLVMILVIWPKFDLIRAGEVDLVTTRDSLDVLRKSKAGLDRVKTDLSDQSQIRILSAMPQDYSPETAIYMLRRISADSGVSIVSYTLPSGVLLDSADGSKVGTGTGDEMVSFVAFPVQLTVAAPVESLLRFISEIESSLPFGVVSDLNLQEVTKLTRTASDKTVQIALEVRFYQTFINKVNITKLEPLTTDELTLAKKLEKYNLLTIPEGSQANLEIAVASGSGSIFGF